MKRCQACQLDSLDSFNYCRLCGGPLITVVEVNEKLIYCPYCGMPAKPAWRFCKRCGSEIEEVTIVPAAVKEKVIENGLVSQPKPIPISAPKPPNHEMAEARRCSQCYTALRSEAKFCDGCGTAVGVTVPPSPARTTAKILDRGDIQKDRFIAVITEPASLKLGGYAEEIAPENPDVKTERHTLRRIAVGALFIFALMAGVLLIRFWLSRTGTIPPISILTTRGDTSSARREPVKLLPASFSVVAIEKEDPLSGGHSHAVVNLNDQALFMIRDEANYRSTIERANAIADHLRQAMKNLSRDPDAEFRLDSRANGPAIVHVTPTLGDQSKQLIVTVLKSDAAGYNRRSYVPVTAEQLAQWWLNRLVDRVNLFVKGQPPKLTTDNDDGRILVELYERAMNRATGTMLTAEVLQETLRQLSPKQRWLLSYEGVRVVPHHNQ